MLARKRLLGEYNLGKTIGQGAFSKVKIAVHRETGEKVAIKVVDKKMMEEKAQKSKAAHDERERKRQVEELKKARAQQQQQQQHQKVQQQQQVQSNHVTGGGNVSSLIGSGDFYAAVSSVQYVQRDGANSVHSGHHDAQVVNDRKKHSGHAEAASVTSNGSAPIAGQNSDKPPVGKRMSGSETIPSGPADTGVNARSTDSTSSQCPSNQPIRLGPSIQHPHNQQPTTSTNTAPTPTNTINSHAYTQQTQQQQHQHDDNAKTTETQPTFISKLQKEVQIMMRLDHPNIVKIYQVLETDEECFIVMEYAKGGELIEYIATRDYLSEKEARKFFRQIISALDHCHLSSVVHRDLKLENVLLNEERNVLLSDFGLGRTFDPDSDEHMKTFCGTPNYAAVELISGIPYVGIKSDIWAMGVVLYIMMTGHPPFSGETIQMLYRKIKAVDYKIPSYFSPNLVDLLKRILVRDPNGRIDMDGLRAHPWVNYEYIEQPLRVMPRMSGNVDVGTLSQVISSIYYDKTFVVYVFRRHDKAKKAIVGVGGGGAQGAHATGVAKESDASATSSGRAFGKPGANVTGHRRRASNSDAVWSDYTRRKSISIASGAGPAPPVPPTIAQLMSQMPSASPSGGGDPTWRIPDLSRETAFPGSDAANRQIGADANSGDANAQRKSVGARPVIIVGPPVAGAAGAARAAKPAARTGRRRMSLQETLRGRFMSHEPAPPHVADASESPVTSAGSSPNASNSRRNNNHHPHTETLQYDDAILAISRRPSAVGNPITAVGGAANGIASNNTDTGTNGVGNIPGTHHLNALEESRNEGLQDAAGKLSALLTAPGDAPGGRRSSYSRTTRSRSATASQASPLAPTWLTVGARNGSNDGDGPASVSLADKTRNETPSSTLGSGLKTIVTGRRRMNSVGATSRRPSAGLSPLGVAPGHPDDDRMVKLMRRMSAVSPMQSGDVHNNYNPLNDDGEPFMECAISSSHRANSWADSPATSDPHAMSGNGSNSGLGSAGFSSGGNASSPNGQKTPQDHRMPVLPPLPNKTDVSKTEVAAFSLLPTNLVIAASGDSLVPPVKSRANSSTGLNPSQPLSTDSIHSSNAAQSQHHHASNTTSQQHQLTKQEEIFEPSMQEIETWHMIHKPPKEIRAMRFSFNAATTSSTLDPAAMFQDIHRVLITTSRAYGSRLHYTRVPDYYMFRCDMTDVDDPDTRLEFEVEICKVWLLKTHGLRMKRIRGDVFTFKDIYMRFASDLHWNSG